MRKASEHMEGGAAFLPHQIPPAIFLVEPDCPRIYHTVYWIFPPVFLEVGNEENRRE
ncbi:MAG: hypothetical protein AB1611_18855 [bacterium]